MVRDPFRKAEEPDLEVVLDALRDPACRTIIQSLEEPMTATELSEHCDIPLSTTYRKLEKLTDSSLLDEQIEVREDGRHTSRYTPHFDAVLVRLVEKQHLELSISRPPRSADERLADLWSEVRQEVS